MIKWMCTKCGRRGETKEEDKIVMKICAACQEEMEVEKCTEQ